MKEALFLHSFAATNIRPVGAERKHLPKMALIKYVPLSVALPMEVMLKLKRRLCVVIKLKELHNTLQFLKVCESIFCSAQFL